MDFQKSEGSIFLNGKAQIIEMLEFMNPEEKAKLLNNIKQRNPALAIELQEKSLTFNDLNKLSDHEIRLFFSHIKPQILGVALKEVNVDFQRRVLALAPRDYAEAAYEILIKPIRDSRNIAKKAQNKIVSIMIAMSKKGQIRL